MNITINNPPSVADCVNTTTFLALSGTNQKKVLIIYSLAIIFRSMNKGKLMTEAFDSLYDTELYLLEGYLRKCEDDFATYNYRLRMGLL